jgi:hypothetical protein
VRGGDLQSFDDIPQESQDAATQQKIQEVKDMANAIKTDDELEAKMPILLEMIDGMVDQFQDHDDQEGEEHDGDGEYDDDGEVCERHRYKNMHLRPLSVLGMMRLLTHRVSSSSSSHFHHVFWFVCSTMKVKRSTRRATRARKSTKRRPPQPLKLPRKTRLSCKHHCSSGIMKKSGMRFCAGFRPIAFINSNWCHAIFRSYNRFCFTNTDTLDPSSNEPS